MQIFYHLLVNTVLSAVANFTVWFGLTFFVYLETQSVFATGMISGVFLTLTMLSGFWFGSLVDHHSKKLVMLGSSAFSFLMYGAALLMYLSQPQGSFADVTNPLLWVLIVMTIFGVIAGNIRNVALPVIIGYLIPEEKRAKANGLAGMSQGISFGVVSVISAFLVAYADMWGVLAFSTALLVACFVHLLLLYIPEREKTAEEHAAPKTIDIRGTLAVVVAIPGLIALIAFTTFNNFLGGAFMALMDAYGLSLVSVEEWGIILGVLSFSFMAGGAAIARWGLGRNPLRTMMLANILLWTACALFTIQASVILLIAGMFLFMAFSPYIEASEQTILQKVVPKDRQGRVFGFAQSVEQMASPVTAFLLGPLAQFFFIPFMTTGLGAELIGWWFGTGQGRGIALVFTVCGIIGLVVTIIALNSKYYVRLSEKYLNA
ncbi:MAG: MFS transporter [Candidatus Pacebacteria bacterium]|nr:MFS transporter [Candidatus Paceibacterota bacterium]MBP9840555.1 MFS transporter [Candidatus Paceibacterota bacterium]